MPATIRIQGDEKLRKALASKTLINEPVRRFLERSAQTVEGKGKQNAPVDTGRLRSSISRDVQPANKRAFVGSKLPYAAPVEFGRPPGTWPPLSALQPWARRHGFPAGNAGAFLVARAIARRGIKPQPYLVPALESSRTAIRGFLNMMAREVEQEFGRRVK